jgi:cytochrome c peroxidase
MRSATLATSLLLSAACRPAALAPAPPVPPVPPPWEAANPVLPLPKAPLGAKADFGALGFRVTPEKVRLGRWLFFDARLSADGTISCATCHEPDKAFSENQPTSTGIGGQRGARKAPPILNAAWPIYPAFFWDGRAASLLEQAKGPMANPIEMGNSHPAVVAAVAGVTGYRRYFAEAFGDDRVDIDRVAEAISAYEATRLSGDSAYDRFDAGDEQALSEEAQEGRDLFFGRARCAACHLGPNFTDGRFHNIGVGWRAPTGGRPASAGFADPGRAAVSQDPRDTGAFKTPTLRDLTRRGPYMHDGSMKTLREVVVYYLRGGEPNPWLDPEMTNARFMPCEVDSIVAFLEALDGQGWQDRAPEAFPR